MDSLLIGTGEHKIFCHEISCLVLVYHTCKHDDDSILTSCIKNVRSDMILLLLDLIQHVQMEYGTLLEQLKRIANGSLLVAFKTRMESLVAGKYVTMLDFFESLESLTLSGNHYVQKSSICGIFVRRLFLAYQKMSFTKTGELGDALTVYLNSNSADKVERMQTLDNSIEEVEDITISEPSLETITTLSQVGQFIASQIKLVESQTLNALSPPELQERIKYILEKFPDAIEAHYLSYLNQLQVNEAHSSLFDLHKYFDYQKWDEEQINANNETDKTSVEKYQIKFKRFRYCALNLGIFHCYLGHNEAAYAALQEAVKMAQMTNDNDCLLHCLFWIYRLQSETNPHQAQTLLNQLIRRAKHHGNSLLQSLGILLQCKFDAFSGNASFTDIQSKLDESSLIMATNSELPSQKIQVGRAAFLDFYGYRAVSCLASQITLYELESSSTSTKQLSGLSAFQSRDSESTILSLCQTSKFLADEGFFIDAQSILKFASTLVPSHSSLQKWILICKWQLIFDRCIFERDIDAAEDAVEQIRCLDRDDADLRECQILFLTGNSTKADLKINELLEKIENSPRITVGNTPVALYHVRLLQLKAELFATSGQFPRAISPLLKCIDLCRKYEMKNMEAEICICLAQCKILLQLPHESKFILNSKMLQILAHGTLYTRSLAFLVLAKAVLFCSGGNFDNTKGDILSLLPSLERCCKAFQTLNAVSAECETLYIMVHIYNLLDYPKQRSKYEREFKSIIELRNSGQNTLKLFI